MPGQELVLLGQITDDLQWEVLREIAGSAQTQREGLKRINSNGMTLHIVPM